MKVNVKIKGASKSLNQCYSTSLCCCVGKSGLLNQVTTNRTRHNLKRLAQHPRFSGLGSLGAGYMQPENIRVYIKKIRTLTHNPFAVNLFIPQAHHATDEQMLRARACIEKACTELGVKIHPVTPPYMPSCEDQMRVICEEDIPVFSFTFGIPEAHWILALQKKGIHTCGTATNVMEARLLEASGVDIVVAQGSEAGGHRGTFIGKAEDSLISIPSLIAQIINEIHIPVVASGGIMDSQGVNAMLSKGAAAVQMGTAFLTCVESGIHAGYKKALLSLTEDETSLTTAFSGKLARGIHNQFIESMANHQNDILDYPIQNAFTRSMRQEASMQNNTEFMSMWAGQCAYKCKPISVAQLINELLNNSD